MERITKLLEVADQMGLTGAKALPRLPEWKQIVSYHSKGKRKPTKEDEALYASLEQRALDLGFTPNPNTMCPMTQKFGKSFLTPEGFEVLWYRDASSDPGDKHLARFFVVHIEER